MHGLRSLVDRQRIVLTESSPFVYVLDEWLESGDAAIGKSHTIQQFFGMMKALAQTRKLEWRWSSASAFERHLMALKDPLKKLYGAEFQETEDSGGKKIVKIRFNH